MARAGLDDLPESSISPRRLRIDAYAVIRRTAPRLYKKTGDRRGT
jgi:hypothetical protein